MTSENHSHLQSCISAAERLLELIDSCKTGIYNEQWVNTIEEACSLITAGLPFIVKETKQPDIIDRLVSCVLDGLDFEKASQQASVFPVRHLKAGMRLAAIMFQTESSIAGMLCREHVQARLLDLLEDPITSVPIMLEILKTLDASLFFGVGLNAFVLGSQIADDDIGLSPYQRLTRFILRKRSSRVMVATHCLMRKIVLNHSLKTVFNLAKKLAHSAGSSEPESKNDDDDESSLSSNAEAVLNEEDITCLCENLIRITEFYRNANDLLPQPPRSLPATAIFVRKNASCDAYSFLYGVFGRNHLLPSLYLLLSHWSTGSEPRIATAIHRLLSSILSIPSGLLYLASQGEVIEEILQLLLHKTQDDVPEEENSSLMQELALNVAHHLRALHYVDELMTFHTSGSGRSEVDDPVALAVLRSFYVLTLDQINDRKGVKAVVRVLTAEQHLGSILPFIELTGDAEWDNRIRKSACAGYASELLLLVLRYAESVDYLKVFQERLLAISSQEVTSKITEVKQWVEPLKKLPSFTYESVEYLAERLKTLVQSEGFVPRIPKELITVLRLMQHVAVEPSRAEDAATPTELCYKFALIQLYRFDVITTLLQLVEKLADSHLLNWEQGISLNNKHGLLFYACVIPAVTLVRCGLSYLIHCRGSEFKDLTPILPLLKLYTVCCTLVPSFGILPEGQIVQKEIVATLLAFTQPEIGQQSDTKETDTSVEGDADKSLWTRMMLALMNYAVEAPYRYVAGLNIFSELLPLPLPLPTKEPLNQQEIAAVQSHRRLWSSQLLPIADQIQGLIRDFAHSTQHTLQQDLRRVCLQLSDLSAEIANVVVKAVVYVALENCEITEKKTNPNQSDEPPLILRRELILPATSAFARVLNLLSYMASQSSFKTCFLSLLHSKKEKHVDDYSRLLQYLLNILNYTSVEQSHGTCQELIVGTLQSLCDEEIGMLTSEQHGTPSERLTCCLPDGEQLREICCAILKHVRNSSQTYATILPALRIFVMLCEHDYGLDCIKKALQTEHGALLALLERLLEEFSGHSSDCISTLSTLLLLLRSLQISDDGTSLRTKKIDVPFARKFLAWKADSENENHCLVKLKNMLAGAMEEDSSLYSLYDDVNNLISMLSTNAVPDEDGQRKSDEQVHLPPAPDILQQFNNRQVWILCSDPSEDRLQSHYWFPPDVLEEDDDQNSERAPYDLEALRTQYLPDFDLAKELADKIRAKRAEEAEAIKRKVIPGIINTSRGERKRFVAPLRGRGSVPRGGATTRMNDPFRSRVPNTSRPPSMHVDDFILAQHTMHGSGAPLSGQGAGDAGQSGMAKPLQRDNTRLGASRGGNDRGNMGRPNRYRGPSPMDERGRSFPKPGGSMAPTGLTTTYRPRGAVFDRPRERHGGNSSSRHTGKSSRSSSSRKSPSSRHRASSK